VIFNNGDVYIGHWTNNKLNGLGKMIGSDGTVKEGQWKDGDFLG